MEGFAILLIVVLIILVLSFRSTTLRALRKQNDDVIRQKENLEKLQKSVDRLSGSVGNFILKQTPDLDKEEQSSKPEPIVTPPTSPVPTSHLDTLVEQFEEDLEDEVLEDAIKEKVLITDELEEQVIVESIPKVEKLSQTKTVTNLAPPRYWKQEKKKSFFEKYPDIERFIGENLINKIGIVILVFGLGFLVKYAIDKNWINEAARVAVGVLSAGALIGLAHRLRKNYKAFSSVLIGGGLALLYFTITLAFHTEGYPLFEKQALTFVILVMITMFAVFLSILYDRVEIAILAILGGFASPLMVSNGSGNYIVLFSYLMVLNVGMLVLSYYKRWRLVNIVAFILTVLLFGSWLAGEILDGDTSTYIGAMFYASGFYVIFFLMNVIYNIKYNIEFKGGDIALILSNTFLFFGYSMTMLADIHDGDFQGLYAVILAVFNFGFAYYIHKRGKKNSNLLYLLIGLVFTFITLAVPLQLQENYITLFWSVEAVLLLWLAQKSGFAIMKLGSVVVSALMLISLVMDWQNNYIIPSYYLEEGYQKMGLAFNKMTITWIVSVLSVFATIWLLKKKEDNVIFRVPSEYYKWLLTAVMFVLIYLGAFLELNYQFYFYFKEHTSLLILLYSFTSVYLLGLSVFAFKSQQRTVKLIVSYLSFIFILVFLFTLSTVYTRGAYMNFSTAEYHLNFILMLRWLSIVSVYGIAYFLFNNVNSINDSKSNKLHKGNVAFLVFVIVYMLSADLDVIAILLTGSRDILYHTQKTGYAILWAVISFALMILGMRNKEQILRVLSLILFGITIAKLFIYDISNFPEGGKIIAFILLGVLLLVISFMYQKVKRIFMEDQDKNEIKEGESSHE